MTFLLAILGFSATIYQLRETEIAVRESQQKPILELGVLAANDVPGNYKNVHAHEITLRNLANSRGKIGATLGLRITNSGTKAASKLWFTFVFKRKTIDDRNKIGKLDVRFFPEKQNAKTQVEYFDYDMRPDFDLERQRYVGITFKFSDYLVIHTDKYDRPLIAEVEIEMDKKDFEAEFEIHYRIQSYEGNEILENLVRKGVEENQIYPIKFLMETPKKGRNT